MHGRVIRRAAAAAFSLLIVASLVAYADTVPADGDVLAGDQTVVQLPPASPGEVVIRQITISLLCGGVAHAAPGSTIGVTFDSAIAPADAAAQATDTTIGPVPADWAVNGCTTPPQRLAANDPVTVTLTMPTTPGASQEFTLMWSRSGTSGLTGMTTITFVVDVVGNTPPTLHLPDDKLVEATSAAGAAVSFAATATDAEDASPPAVTCTPDSGSTFPLGVTKVSCSATDDGGLTAKGSFLVTVEDTTAPSIGHLPDDISVTTTSPDGRAVSWPAVTASDDVDPSPSIGCNPSSGDQFPVGTTTVTCTARDAAGNTSHRSFHVAVTYVPPVTWTVAWGEPVATNGSTFVANAGRTVPVKVRMFANGVEKTSGAGVLAIATCDGAAVSSMAMSWSGGRWNGSLDTGAMGGPGCYVATASLDGNVAGSFRIDLRGADPTAVRATKSLKP